MLVIFNWIKIKSYVCRELRKACGTANIIVKFHAAVLQQYSVSNAELSHLSLGSAAVLLGLTGRSSKMQEECLQAWRTKCMHQCWWWILAIILWWHTERCCIMTLHTCFFSLKMFCCRSWEPAAALLRTVSADRPQQECLEGWKGVPDWDCFGFVFWDCFWFVFSDCFGWSFWWRLLSLSLFLYHSWLLLLGGKSGRQAAQTSTVFTIVHKWAAFSAVHGHGRA